MTDFEILEQHKGQINRISGAYQSVGGKRFGRHQIVEIPFVKGLSVLDVGCNAGLHSLVASKYCPSVTGVEELHNIYIDAISMKSYFQKNIHEFNPDRVQFKDGSVVNVEGEFEAVMAFNVLYHLDKPNLSRLTEILKSAQRVLVQARKKVSKDQNDLNLPEKVIKYLEDLGFYTSVKNPKGSRPFIFGQK